MAEKYSSPTPALVRRCVADHGGGGGPPLANPSDGLASGGCENSCGMRSSVALCGSTGAYGWCVMLPLVCVESPLSFLACVGWGCALRGVAEPRLAVRGVGRPLGCCGAAMPMRCANASGVGGGSAGGTSERLLSSGFQNVTPLQALPALLFGVGSRWGVRRDRRSRTMGLSGPALCPHTP